MATASSINTEFNFEVDISRLPSSLQVCSITWKGKGSRYLVPNDSNIHVVDSRVRKLKFCIPQSAQELSLTCSFENRDLNSVFQSLQFQRPEGDRLLARISGDEKSIKLESIKATKAAESVPK